MVRPQLRSCGAAMFKTTSLHSEEQQLLDNEPTMGPNAAGSQ